MLELYLSNRDINLGVVITMLYQLGYKNIVHKNSDCEDQKPLKAIKNDFNKLGFCHIYMKNTHIKANVNYL